GGVQLCRTLLFRRRFSYRQPAGSLIALRQQPLCFNGAFAGDPNLDYAQWANRKNARFLSCRITLLDYAGANKQLALIFGFDVAYSSIPGRVLVYSDAGLLQDQQLIYGDNQFLLEIE